LGCGESQTFLMILHFSSEIADIHVLFLDDAVEPFALLREDVDSVASISVGLLEGVLEVEHSFFEFFAFAADDFDLVGKFVDLSCGES
jgi:hypothetical protein